MSACALVVPVPICSAKSSPTETSRERAQGGSAESGYEVWSLATVEDVEQLAEALADVSGGKHLAPASTGF